MTVTEELAAGISSSSPNDMPSPLAIRCVTAKVGFACSRSIWLSIERLTPLAVARSSSDDPRSARSFFMRSPRWREQWVAASLCRFTGLLL